MQFVTMPGGGPTGIMVKCDTCSGNGNVPDDSGPEQQEKPERIIIDDPSSQLMMSLLFLLLPFLGGAQELFRFTSTSRLH